jgi:hypothetical protein
MEHETSMEELCLDASDHVELEALPDAGRVHFRAICGAGGKELGEPLIELDAITKVLAATPGAARHSCVPMRGSSRCVRGF